MKQKPVITALLEEYKYVLDDLKHHTSDITREELSVIVDTQTPNKDCVSIQSVLTHVVLCGYHYITMMNIHEGNADSEWHKRIRRGSVEEYFNDIDDMYEQTVKFLESIDDGAVAKFDPKDKLITLGGQYYDYEQLMEHAIVHVSRHRRQIVKFRDSLRGNR